MIQGVSSSQSKLGERVHRCITRKNQNYSITGFVFKWRILGFTQISLVCVLQGDANRLTSLVLNID